MGLFSKRRNKGFDDELWSDAADRAKSRGDTPWFSDVGADDPALDDLATNAGARFDEKDAQWLADDPGAEIRRSKR